MIGFWKSEAETILSSFFEDGKHIEASVMNDITSIVDDQSLHKQIYLTFLAIHVLKEQFEDRKDEWSLIVKKALDYLKSLGFKKPAMQIWKFDLSFELADESTDITS